MVRTTGRWCFEKLETMWRTLPDYTDTELEGIRCPLLLMVGEKDIVCEDESRRVRLWSPRRG